MLKQASLKSDLTPTTEHDGNHPTEEGVSRGWSYEHRSTRLVPTTIAVRVRERREPERGGTTRPKPASPRKKRAGPRARDEVGGQRAPHQAKSILDAARALFVAEGYQNVSIRKIAEQIHYSPAAIYSYFASKDDIFLALTEEGFRLLFQSSDECAHAVDPSMPLECIRRAFLNIYTFSKTHPEYHALMFLDRSVPRISQDWERFGFVGEMRKQLTARIQDAIDRDDFPSGSDPEVIFRVLMVSIQGVCVVRLCDRMPPGEDADALARVTLEAALTGLRTGFSHSYRPDSCF